jgi:hypothetical protein
MIFSENRHPLFGIMLKEWPHPPYASKGYEPRQWRVAMAKPIKTNCNTTSRIMTWAAVAWVAIWLTPYLYAVNDLITWR